MKLFRVKVDNRELNKVLKNVTQYSNGFVDGIDMQKIILMNRLGEYVVDLLGKYIDAQARGNPDALHHVYEWGAVGSSGGRLFKMNAAASSNHIVITGNFLPSSSISDTATEPFVDKANIMENGIGITIAPRDSDFLAFEADGMTVFTMNEVYVANPGGDGVAGSFGRVVEDFFGNYFTRMLLKPFLNELSTAEEFTQFFAQGARSGYSVGVRAGQKYINSAGVAIE
jgi:hypothetical protein